VTTKEIRKKMSEEALSLRLLLLIERSLYRQNSSLMARALEM